MPFVINKGDETDFGDMGLTVKTMFHETRNLSISGGLGVRFATGDEPTGGKTWGLYPHFSVGQTITPHNAVLGDFTYYLATNIKVPLDNSNSTTSTVLPQTPGVRGQTGGSSLMMWL